MHRLAAPPAEEDSVSCLIRRRILVRKSTAARVMWISLAFVGGAIIPAEAGLACWGSQGFVENADSRSRPWTPDFIMTLGVFQKGFLPTADNREEWIGHWIGLDVAVFDPLESRFAGVVDLARPLPAGADPQVYFWARNGDDLKKGPEWLLLTRPDWKWPAVSPADSPALTWTTGTPASPVVGEIGVNGHHLTSARVVPVPVTFDDWLNGYFPDSSAGRNPDADPDGDGLGNRIEFFLGSNPNDGASTVCPQIRTGGDGTRLSLRRNPRVKSGFSVETSTNLLTWKPSDPETVVDQPDLIEVRIPRDAPVKSAFFRIKLDDSKP